MAKVTLQRTKDMGTRGIARGTVKPGQLFQLVKKDGSLGRTIYGALGNNGRNYSVNMTSGQLASTAKPQKKVSVVGKFAVGVTYCGNVATTRGAVTSGDIFKVKGKDTAYLALGRLTDGRWASLNMNDPLNEDYAVTSNGKSHVTVIGHAEFKGTHVA